MEQLCQKTSWPHTQFQLVLALSLYSPVHFIAYIIVIFFILEVFFFFYKSKKIDLQRDKKIDPVVMNMLNFSRM